MDGILSQDEINALLSGMDLSGDGESADNAPENSLAESFLGSGEEGLLTDTEKDAIGEIANISMGSSATTLYSLVNQKVNITTPNVTLSNWNEVIRDYQRPFVFIQIRYTDGLDGSTIMILNEQDVKIITDLMMGGDGSNTSGEIGELHLSAISEAMNQMMGASATSMSTMLGKKIDISPPEANRVNLEEAGKANENVDFLRGEFVKVSFRMQIGELIDSIIMQLYPVDFAKNLYEIFTTAQEPTPSEPSTPEPMPYVPPVAEPAPAPVAPLEMTMPEMPQMGAQPGYGMPQMDMGMQSGYGMPQMGMQPGYGMPQMGMQPGYGMPQMGMQPGYGMPQMGMQPEMANMNIQPAQFQNFSQQGGAIPGQENIGIIMDVPLEVTVELGRTKKSISEILNFAPGTIIELEKIAGEPVDVLVNGKYVAKGEVVVIEESFGVRVTEIIK